MSRLTGHSHLTAMERVAEQWRNAFGVWPNREQHPRAFVVLDYVEQALNAAYERGKVDGANEELERQRKLRDFDTSDWGIKQRRKREAETWDAMPIGAAAHPDSPTTADLLRQRHQRASNASTTFATRFVNASGTPPNQTPTQDEVDAHNEQARRARRLFLAGAEYAAGAVGTGVDRECARQEAARRYPLKRLVYPPDRFRFGKNGLVLERWCPEGARFLGVEDERLSYIEFERAADWVRQTPQVVEDTEPEEET